MRKPGLHSVPPLSPAPPLEMLDAVPPERRGPLLACFTRPVVFRVHQGFNGRRPVAPAPAAVMERADETAAFLAMNWQQWRLAELVERMRDRRLTVGALLVLAGWAAESVAMRNAIAVAHIGLVHLVGGRVHPKLDDDERQSLQRILLRAVDGFDATRGVRFSTYATASMFRAAWKMRRVGSRAIERLPSQSQGEMGWATARDVHGENIEAEARRARDAVVRRLVEELDERTRYVLVRRFGLDGGKPATLEAIGVELCLTKESIRQIQLAGLRAVREGLPPE